MFTAIHTSINAVVVDDVSANCPRVVLIVIVVVVVVVRVIEVDDDVISLVRRKKCRRNEGRSGHQELQEAH